MSNDSSMWIDLVYSIVYAMTSACCTSRRLEPEAELNRIYSPP